MNFYLLPWSNKKTKMDLIKRDLREVWRDTRFPQLNPLRESVIKELDVETYPLAPAYRRYKGKFWEELIFWALPSKVKEELERGSVVLSPLMGLLGISDSVPYYEVEWETQCCGRSLKEFWREHVKELTERLFDGATVWDFMSTKERDILSLPENTRRVSFEYYRKGARVINTLPHRAYTLRYVVEMGVGTESLERINFLDYKVKEVREEERGLKVVLQGEGRYI